MKALLH